MNVIEPTAVAWGELLWDVYEDGAVLGGCAANFAYHLAKTGARPELISRVGKDERGRQAIAELQAAGVGTEWVYADANLPTGEVQIRQAKDGTHHFHVLSQAAWDAIALPEAFAEKLACLRLFYFGTLAQRTPLVAGALKQAIALLPANCARFCDLNLRKPYWDRAIVEQALAWATILKVNRKEASAVAELLGDDNWAQNVQKSHGVDWVILTDGEVGAELYDGRGKWLIAAHEPGAGKLEALKNADAIGAGDAFSAAFCRGFLAGQDPRDSVAAANEYAAYVVARKGAMPRLPQGLIDQWLHTYALGDLP